MFVTKVPILPKEITLLWIGLLICLMVYSWLTSSRKRMYSLAKNIPVPKKLPWFPLVGHCLNFIGGSERIMRTMIVGAKANTAVTAKILFGPILFVVVQKAEDVEIVFNSQYAIEKHFLYKFGKNFVGQGILTAPAPIWRKHRKAILPMFSQQILNGFVPIFVEQSNLWTRIIGEGAKEFVDVTKWIGNCTLDMLCESVMGVQLNAQTTDSKIGYATFRILELAGLRMFNPIYYPDFIYKLTPSYREEQKLTKYFGDFTLKVIRERKQRLEELRGEIDNGDRKVLLDLFLEPKKEEDRFTDAELKDEVATFIAAGIDTSATVVGFVLVLLALHPEIQERVHEEVIDILGPDRDVQSNDLSKFTYLERVIKETMRIFPLGVLIGRDVTEDIQLESCTVPKGCGVGIFTWGTHRNPEYYPDPEKFDPDRFLPEEVAKRHPYAYYPFTAGLRKCIGPKYAMMAMVTMLSNLIRKFVIETKYKNIQDIRLKEALILRPINGFIIRVKERNKY